jgi:hypothetical protein
MQERNGADAASTSGNSDAKRAFDVAMQELRRVVSKVTKRLISKSEKLVDGLISTGCIEKSSKRQLWNENAIPPRMYILL